MKGVVYIAGPMRGRPDDNFPAFREAAAVLRALGWTVVSPHEITETVFSGVRDLPPREYMAEDIRQLLRCDAIAVLEGWEASTGARCEAAIATTLGLVWVDWRTGEVAPPASRILISGGYDRPPHRPESLDDLREEVIAWANQTFRQATAESKATHLCREAAELRNNPTDLSEMADVFILLSHLSAGHDLAAAVRGKLEVNRGRTWGEPDAEGVVEHVPSAGEP